MDQKYKKWDDFGKKEEKVEDVVPEIKEVKVEEVVEKRDWKEAEEVVPEVVEEIKLTTLDLDDKKPTIKQLALNNQLVRTYTSIEEAAKHTGIAADCIEDACEGVDRYIFGGFKWMYI